jgi:hypothetical protein
MVLNDANIADETIRKTVILRGLNQHLYDRQKLYSDVGATLRTFIFLIYNHLCC